MKFKLVENRLIRPNYIIEDLTIDDDPEETEQQYSSASTSINSSKLPAVFKMVDFERGVCKFRLWWR